MWQPSKALLLYWGLKTAIQDERIEKRMTCGVRDYSFYEMLDLKNRWFEPIEEPLIEKEKFLIKALKRIVTEVKLKSKVNIKEEYCKDCIRYDNCAFYKFSHPKMRIRCRHFVEGYHE